MSNSRPSCAHGAGAFKRNGADRFAQKLAEEHRESEVAAAIYESIHSSSRADHSAAQELADEFDTDLSTVYRWALKDEERLACRPVEWCLRFTDAVIRAKGPHNPAAYAIPRLFRRLYLDPQPDSREATPALVTSTAAETMAVVGSLLADLLHAVDPSSPGGTSLTPDEWQALEPQIERATALLESLRLMGPTALRGSRATAQGVQ